MQRQNNNRSQLQINTTVTNGSTLIQWAIQVYQNTHQSPQSIPPPTQYLNERIQQIQCANQIYFLVLRRRVFIIFGYLSVFINRRVLNVFRDGIMNSVFQRP